MMRKKEFEYVKNLWNESKGNPDIYFTLLPKDQEEKMILESLSQRGVLKRSKGSYHVCLTTKFFLENNGKTEHELEKEKEIFRQEESLRIAKRSNYIAFLALGLSALSAYFTFFS